ncbi:uncharacterized protein [Drosophila kikkawai]|uniref:Uncharacterized protein n=1 Tax=Drosophila kikkawai TaxID=30033 RepID=A0ABM4GB69_DROKI
MSAPKLFSTFFLLVILYESWAATSVPNSVLWLVPPRVTKGVTVDSFEDRYLVRIILPSLAYRLETVKEISPGNLNVKGYYKEPFFDRPKSPPLVLEINYEAGVNGYTAKYSIVRKEFGGVNLAVLKTWAG